MGEFSDQTTAKCLYQIKEIARLDKNGDKFIIVSRQKNNDFMKENELTLNDVKNIVLGLELKDCFDKPQFDRNENYQGFVFKFCPIYADKKLYLKIRLELTTKVICLSIHEFGKI